MQIEPVNNIQRETGEVLGISASGRSRMIKYRPFILGLITFGVLAFIGGAFTSLRYQVLQANKKQEGYNVVNAAKDRLQQTLAHGLSATKTLSFFIDKNGTVHDFDTVAAEILSSSKYLDAVELVPGGVIKYVYPFAENKAAVGYNILKDPSRNKEANMAIEKNEFFFAGPLQLKQGGMAVVGRLPVFRNGEFWGFSAVVIKVPNLLKAAGIDSTGKSGFYFQLSKINPDTHKEEYFMPEHKSRPANYNIGIDLPNGEWKLTAVPVDPGKGNSDIILLAIAALLFSVFGGLYVFILVKNPQKLNEQVKERTSQLKESKENYKTLFGKSPLPMWIYDLETYKFLEVNEAAINLYGYSRKEFLEMDATKIRPETGIEQFYTRARSGTDALSEAYVVTHLKRDGEEIQAMVFSRNTRYNKRNGRLVLVMDVSEKIKAETALIKSEEKYRTLIEQASDGIILYSFDGTIHEFNRTAYMQAGYTREEFGKLNLSDLLYENKIVINSGKADEIRTGNNTTLNRKVKRKDGTVMEAELNVKMLPDGKIIAFIRDITERVRIAEALQNSENRFRTIFETEPECIKMLNSSNELLDMNPAGLAIIEANDLDQVKNRSVLNIIDEEYREDFAQLTREVFNGTAGKLLFAITGLKGSKRWLETHAVPFKDKTGNIISLLAVTRDITERIKADKELNLLNQQLRQFSGYLQNIREEERTNIAREIQDELGQQLAGLKMDIFWLFRKIDKKETELKQKAENALQLIDNTIMTMRKVSTDLRPSILDDLGLAAAMEWQSEEFEKRTGIVTDFRNNLNGTLIESKTAIAIFRIYQELLAIIGGHASDCIVEVSVKFLDGRLCLNVACTGKDFAIETPNGGKTLALLSVKERALLLAGEYKIENQPGQGTTITISIPLEGSVNNAK